MDREALQATVARAGHDLVTKPPPTTKNMSDELGKKKNKTNMHTNKLKKKQKSVLNAKIE